jgi:hypothetical protein
MDRTLREALARYSAWEAEPTSPTREHYAAARRWLACARDALRWARESPEPAASVSRARAADALSHARQHRAWARRWRRAIGPGEAPPANDVPELDEATRKLLEQDAAVERAAATVRAYYAAARHTLRLVRVYRSEAGTTGRREREALAEVRHYREAIRTLRDRPVDSGGPGLRKAGGSEEPGGEQKRVG